MKRVLFIAIMCLLACCVQSQTSDTVRIFPYVTNFSPNLDGWTPSDSATWTTGYFQSSTTPVALATVPSTISQWLVSPPLQLPNDTVGLQMRWDNAKSGGPQINYFVLVTTNNGLSWDTITTWNYYANQSYLQDTWPVDLAPYAGQTVRVAFCVPPTAGTRRTLNLTNLTIRSDRMPWGYWWSNERIVQVGDTVEHSYSLSTEPDSLTTANWHSTMVTNGLAIVVDTPVINNYGDVLYRVRYNAAGIDTVTLTVSNAFGTLITNSHARVYDCQPINTFPWIDTFPYLGSYNVCWQMNNFVHNDPGTNIGSTDENGELWNSTNHLQTISNSDRYLITPPIAVPYNAQDLAFGLSYWGNCSIDVLASSSVGTDLSLFTDTLATFPRGNARRVRKVHLGQYAGQTIRLALMVQYGYIMRIFNAGVDYDTLPKIDALTVPARIYNDSAVRCTASLRYGSTTNLHYTWLSARGATIVTNALGDSAYVTAAGGSDYDTLTVIATNAFGSDTMSQRVRVVDCSPATTLPWLETFADGLRCWYKPEGSNWFDNVPQYQPESARLLQSMCGSSTLDSWIISKAITIPADTALGVRLFWDVASNNNNFHFNYSVLATVGNPTDTNSYIPLYVDTLTHTHFSSFDHMSVSLAQFAGQTIHLAFRNQSPSSNTTLYIDNITVRPTAAPIISLSAPTLVYDDEVAYTATLVEGSPNGLTYTWHSSLMDTTFVGDSTITITYDTAGWDTVSVIAANLYGSDTATTTTEVRHCAVRTVPWSEDFSSDSTRRCWAGLSAYHLSDGWAANVDSRLLVSPAIDMPTNSGDVQLRWTQENPPTMGVNTLVLVSPTGSTDLADFTDTILAQLHNSGTDSVVLGNAYAGQRIRVAFGVCYPNYGEYTLVSNINMGYNTTAPQISLSAPSDITVGTAISFTAHLNVCSQTGMTIAWHSSLLDSTIHTSSPSLQLVYPIGGYDTLTLVVSNAYGADTAVATFYVLNCNATALPYTEDFQSITPTAWNAAGNIPQCWNTSSTGTATDNTPHVVDSYTYMSNLSNNALLMIAGSTTGYSTNVQAILPCFASPLQQLSMSFDYCFESATQGTLIVGYWNDSINLFTPVDTITPHAGNYICDTVSFAAATDSNAHIAISWVKTSTWYGVAIDNIRVYNSVNGEVLPWVAILGPTSINAFDTATFTAQLLDGDTAGLTYTWHSAMAARGLAQFSTLNSQLSIIYTAVGIDTLTLTATNVHGSRSVQQIVAVTGLPQVSILGPATVTSGASVVYTAHFTAGVDTATTYTWHSAMATRGLAQFSTLNSQLSILYNVGGTDTLTLTVTTLLGSTTSTRIITVIGCTPISTYPYSEGFESGLPDCWTRYCASTDQNMHVWYDQNYSSWCHTGNHCMVSQNLTYPNQNIADWLMMPAVQVPASGNASLYFWVNFVGNPSGFAVLASTTGRGSTAFFTDTLFYESNHTHTGNNYSATYVPRSVSLAAYAGQTVYLAFVHGSPSGLVFLDDVGIDISGLPEVRLTGPSTVRSCDSAVFQATQLDGDTIGLTLTWHSTKASRGRAYASITDGRMAVDYYEGGRDTITVIATNAFGSDTARLTCTITDCEPINQFPYTTVLNSYNSITCWDSRNYSGDGGFSAWCLSDYLSSGTTCITSEVGWPNLTYDAWLIAQELEIPADNSYTLQWHILCDHASYQVLASTTGRVTIDGFTDTLFSELRDTASWTTRSVSLDAYCGQRLYIAFRTTGWNNTLVNYCDIGVIRIDTVRIVTTLDTNTAPDTVRYLVTIQSANDTMGSVNPSGIFEVDSGAYFTATAVAEEGYHFEGWSLFPSYANLITENPLSITVTSDLSIEAYFAPDTTEQPDTIWRTVRVNTVMWDGSQLPSSLTVTGEGIYPDNTTATLTAHYGSDPIFWYWITASGDTLYDNPYSFLVTSDTVFTAVFGPSSMGIGNSSAAPLVRLYPNPATTTITIEAASPVTVSLIDLQGRTVGSWQLQAGKVILDLSHCPSGAYFVHTVSPQGVTISKLIVNKQ